MGDWILGLPVLAMAAVILAATWLGTAMICITWVKWSVLLLASHSHPFSGAISVKPTVLQQVMPEAQ